jgi:hypothetical protein
LILLLFLAVPLTAQEDSTKDTIPAREYPLIPMPAIEDALRGIKMTPADLSYRTDYVERDTFRIPLIDSLTQRPLEMASFVDANSKKFLGDSLALNAIIDTIRGSIITDRIPSLKFLSDTRVIIRYELPENEGHIAPPQIEYPKDISEADAVSLDQVLLTISEYLGNHYIFRNYRHTFPANMFSSDLSESDLVFLRDSFPILILEDVNDEFRPLPELDSLQKFEEELSIRAIPVCEKLKMEFLGNAHWYQIVHFDSLIIELKTSEAEYSKLFDSRDWQIEKETIGGKIAIGGWGENHYEGKYMFILDFGGDDQYLMDHNDSLQIIIDLSGNDKYIAREDHCLGSGFLGVGILYDGRGDDLYGAKNFSLGSGLFGIGVLIDESGNDTYYGDTHTQGAGTFGIGLLIDRGGNDEYKAALFGQAYAGVDGFGSIIEHDGNDTYYAGGKYKDFLRYEDHYISLSQGFAFGVRPRMSGGVAMLIDSAGHDTYISDIFGQGASYWYGLGALYDLSGNDKYLSFQYAQGSATHLTLAILMDKAGNDYYFSKGVSQGCGHDLAAGYLIDYAGDDTYQAYDLSQAAGSANGTGMLIDYLGNDSYEVKADNNTQGYGNPRRDYGSIGLFMDLEGEDHYIGNGKNNHYWIIDSKWGIGMDKDYWQEDEK